MHDLGCFQLPSKATEALHFWLRQSRNPGIEWSPNQDEPTFWLEILEFCPILHIPPHLAAQDPYFGLVGGFTVFPLQLGFWGPQLSQKSHIDHKTVYIILIHIPTSYTYACIYIYIYIYIHLYLYIYISSYNIVHTSCRKMCKSYRKHWYLSKEV